MSDELIVTSRIVSQEELRELASVPLPPARSALEPKKDTGEMSEENQFQTAECDADCQHTHSIQEEAVARILSSLDTIIEEAEELPQIGQQESTIIEAAEDVQEQFAILRLYIAKLQKVAASAQTLLEMSLGTADGYIPSAGMTLTRELQVALVDAGIEIRYGRGVWK